MQINNNFIKQHDRLVRTIVNQYHVANVDPEDLMQEGRIGLIEAAKRFDPNRGIQFASYASWWVRKYITLGLSDYGNAVRISKHAKDAMDRCVSLSFDDILYIEDGDPITFADTLTDGVYKEAEMIEQEEKAELHERLRRAIDSLTKNERYVLCHLYGFEAEEKTMDQIAAELHISREWVRKLHKLALKALSNQSGLR